MTRHDRRLGRKPVDRETARLKSAGFVRFPDHLMSYQRLVGQRRTSYDKARRSITLWAPAWVVELLNATVAEPGASVVGIVEGLGWHAEDRERLLRRAHTAYVIRDAALAVLHAGGSQALLDYVRAWESFS